MSSKQDFIHELFESVTQDILAPVRQKQDVSNNIDAIIRERAERIVPNIADKSNHIVGSIYDPSTGWTHEANSGNSASNSYGTPIIDADGYNAVKLALERPDKFSAEQVERARKIKEQDGDFEERFYSPEYLGKYQNSKVGQLEVMFSDAVNNPMKYALETGLPLQVVQRMNPLSAAQITSKDFVTLQVNDNLIETLGLASLQYNLVEAFARVAAPNLVAKYWSFSDIEVETNVPEGDIIEGTKNEMEEIKYQIGKNVGAVEATWESQLMVTKGDPLGQISGRIPAKLAQTRNIMMATTIETATTASGALFDAKTAGISDNDPMDTIQPVLDGIISDVSVTAFPNQSPTVWISGAKAFNKFNSNTNTKGQFTANGQVILNNQQSGGVGNVPAGTTWRTSSLVAATKLWIADPRAVPAIFGPSQRSEYFDNRNLSRATYYFDAFGTKLVSPNAIREITTVVS